MVELIFWMNMPSFYQSDLFRALTRRDEISVKVFFANRIPEERVRLGWQDDLVGFDYEFLDKRRPVADAVKKAWRYRGCMHVVGGLWAGRVPEAVLATLFVSGSKYFVYSEAPDRRVGTPMLKRTLSMLLGRAITMRAKGVLPISRFAIEYFKSYGVHDRKIYPFGYFRSMPPGSGETKPAGWRDGIDVVFVGQLVHRKGIDILLSAIEPMFAADNGLRLHLIGSGELETELREWVMKRNLSSRVLLEGAVDSKSIIARLSEADLLVLPSRWDGWGIVVNEALMAGVPVIVSDMCGAADVIRDGVNGYVFHSEDAEDLRKKLGIFLEHVRAGESLRVGAKQTGAGLDAENAAKYLINVIAHRESKREDSSVYPWVTGTC